MVECLTCNIIMTKGTCINCGNPLQEGKIYCSKHCQNDYHYKKYISEWKEGKKDGMKGKNAISTHIRKYLFEKNNNRCEICGWGEINPYTNRIPLEVHHIDGNYKNNNEENLQLLCPNCHSLTKNFKSRGKGREEIK